MTQAETLVIIPAYNEEDALPAVLHELRAVRPDDDVLVVDDGSTDRTTEVAREAGVRVVTLPFNLGVGGALRTGFRYAVRAGYQRAVQFDGDGQHDPAEIETLLAGLDAGADLVIGSRFVHGEQDYEVGRLRRGAMRLLQRGVKLLSGQAFTDTSSGFRAFDRDTLELFAAQYPVDYLGDSVEALLTACGAGLRVAEVPVRMRVRAAGVPSARSLKLVYHYLRVLVVMAAAVPRRSRRAREAAN